MPIVLRALYRLSYGHMRCLLLLWFTMYYYFILTNRDHERLSNSSETTQRVNGRAGIKIQFSDSKVHVLLFYFYVLKHRLPLKQDEQTKRKEHTEIIHLLNTWDYGVEKQPWRKNPKSQGTRNWKWDLRLGNQPEPARPSDVRCHFRTVLNRAFLCLLLQSLTAAASGDGHDFGRDTCSQGDGFSRGLS